MTPTVTEEQETATERHFKLVGGIHIEELPRGKQKLYKRGEIVTSTLDLLGMFPSKFTEVHETRLPQRKKEASVAQEVSEPVRGKSPFGKDITANYESAEEAGFQVFIKDGEVTVVDEDVPTVALNKTPLLKSKVDSFIAKHLRN